MKVIVDLDGINTDFVKGACHVHQRPDPYLEPNNFGKWDMEKIWGMSKNEFWTPMGFHFWDTLEWLPLGKELMQYLFMIIGVENVCISTAPCDTPGCVDGKISWIKREIPQIKKQYLIGSPKQFTAHENSILIDDMDKNILSFEEAGGMTFQVPRPWNSLHARINENWFIQLQDKIELFLNAYRQ